MKPQYRQIPAAVLAVLTALSLTACGSGGADSKESTANDSVQSESTPKTPQVAQPENFDTYVSNTCGIHRKQCCNLECRARHLPRLDSRGGSRKAWLCNIIAFFFCQVLSEMLLLEPVFTSVYTCLMKTSAYKRGSRLR